MPYVSQVAAYPLSEYSGEMRTMDWLQCDLRQEADVFGVVDQHHGEGLRCVTFGRTRV